MNNDKQSIDSIVEKMARTMAKLYYFMAKEVVEEFGEAGKEAVKRAVINYGEYRGKQIREKVEAQGLPLTVENLGKFYDLPLGFAWKSDKLRKEENLLEKKVTYCPFAEEWKSLGAEELGLIYCLQDEALRKAFNPDFDFTQFTNVLSGHKDCHTVLKNTKQEQNK